MKARLVRIGNSRGVRLPKALIEEAGLSEDVELSVRSDGVLITPIRAARAGWAESARVMAERDESGLLDPAVPTRFDDDEWTW